ncbi:F-box only protein 6-like isoform X2 [Haliotis rufescens]|uniref:F-box only protein 6-like isoform X2 n=1 Tax=Haliotis rufescens TaxID=6454 RepID=UPI00201F884B|nr:F-box only protein 6-like isoform X2 [Haliotis rufescens]
MMSGHSCLVYEIPESLIIEILLQVPAKDIVQNCVLVSRQLNDIIASPTLWKRKCKLEGKYIPRFVKPEDFKKMYFFNPYTRNLIKNPCAQEWPERNINKWATSYGHCEKMQRINLGEEGVVAEVLDTIKPTIYISEWFAARQDCACHYELEVRLLSGDEQELDRFTFEDNVPQWTSGEWTKMQHVFKDYKAGVRFIEFRHLGVDRQFWAGHYGPKFTLSSVKFMFD